ncbi:lactate 2-monooxygenase [Mesobacillus harenae]|uniref:lactate 2-monooxygenase n=1 Tax=Mesobacillus harenae TaxID=2213203 RepID=UPI001580DD93|nr:lactate 2-monooxygenase [Mesobacillus harenae]
MSFGNVVQQKVYNHLEEAVVPVSYEDLEREAKNKLEAAPYYYVAASAGGEETADANREGFLKWKIVPRMLCDTSKRDLSTELFGKKLSYPILCAPIGVQSIIHPEGELASARAASEMDIPFISSTASTHSLENVAEATGDGLKWFQLYWSNDREIAASMVKRAEAAGYSAIVITVDTPMMAWREKDIENKYLPFIQGKGIGNFLEDPVFCSKLAKPPKEDMASATKLWSQVFGNPTLTWDDLQYIRMHTSLPILLKGILHPDDAKLAVEHGMDGIIVSNHGGRQVDGAIAAIDALPDVCEAVAGRVPVLMDSGIRRGADVVKAIALGAQAVLVGRPYIYGLALAGEAGVKQVLRNLIADLDLTMALSGKKSLAEIDRSLLKKV